MTGTPEKPFVVVQSEALPYAHLEADRERKCLGRHAVPMTNFGGIMGGPFIYADQVKIDGLPISVDRIDVCNGRLRIDGQEPPAYELHHDDGTIREITRTAQ